MTLTIFRVMLLGLARDRGALAMTFALPPLIFIVFAAVFAAADGENLRLRIAVLDQVDDGPSRQLVDVLRNDPELHAVPLGPGADETALRDLIRRGQVDAGILIRHPLAASAATDEAPVHVLADQSKALAAPMVAGRLQSLIQSELPALGAMRTVHAVEALIGGYTEPQRRHLRTALAEAEQAPRDRATPLLSQEAIAGKADGTISYYAGAVAVLFLLFSAMQSATGLVEERDSGVVERLRAGPGGTRVIVLGKTLFLIAQGMLQVTLIFLVAWLGYGVDLPGNIHTWFITTLLAALAASGLALAVAVGCRTRSQAQTLATFLVLVFAAIGGSMIPRFMMPSWLQDIGWLTPNAWAVEAYQTVLWRGESVAALLPAWSVLAGIGIVAIGSALVMAQRMSRA